MKLLTLNCHSWQEENQIEKMKVLAETIKANDYDIIALQEVSQPIHETLQFDNMKKDNFALLLLAELQQLKAPPYHCIWDLSHIAYETYEEGVALLTKHPIQQKHSFFVSKSHEPHQWKTRRIVGADLRYFGETLSVYSCHLGWWDDPEEPFSHQAALLLQQINKENTVFLMGDFNNDANQTGEGYEYLLKQGLFDTYILANEKDCGTTVKGSIAGWHHNSKELRLDLILTNQPVPVRRSNVIFNGQHCKIISDHFGVEVEIILDIKVC
ncbi:endonuclease/exonuclease/phosphatase family protein [Melghirimyces algeriensis]|uniref:Maltose 6'-phosphate phosphatase n=1 Tax=Melghirimyces algeriensis TaxID=910412 RepID=A0A521ACA4_9BACL|nr:endonuclease/exonuclease/phosphatase family protein [Melghirimyces algeriensis]SMO32401.1 maltose 6'-phosphate phosphatase [Melghirimyces algeriensis]